MIALEVIRKICLKDLETESLSGIILAETTEQAFKLWHEQKKDDLSYCKLIWTGYHIIPDEELEFRSWLDEYGPTMWVNDFALNRLFHYIHP